MEKKEKIISIGCSEYPDTKTTLSYEEGKEFEELERLDKIILNLKLLQKITNRQGANMMQEACQKMNYSYNEYITKKFENVLKSEDGKICLSRYLYNVIMDKYRKMQILPLKDI